MLTAGFLGSGVSLVGAGGDRLRLRGARWNALVYVSAGERARPELSGRSVAVAATVVFGLSALATPPLGALTQQAGWDAFWLTTAALALAGSAVAATLPRLW